MSTDQPQLSDFEGSPSLTEAVLDDRGAAYGRSERQAADAPDNGPENSCLNCGREVSAQIARVIGDNDGNIPACAAPECREDMIIDHSLSVDSYQETIRVVRAVRSRDRGVTTDNPAGGRR